MIRVILLILFFCNAFFATAQEIIFTQDSTNTNEDSVLLTICSIALKGNKITKEYIIYREVPFKVGNAYTAKILTEQLELAKEQIMNTTLFNEVLVYVSNRVQNNLYIQIEVKERWYLFPLPFFRLIDRNFNQWWYDQKRSLDRVNYGLKFFHNNFTGRNDKLSLDIITGYSQQIVFNYNQPFADASLKHGFNVGFSYNRQKEINYKTENNQQKFFKLENDFVKEMVRGSITYSYRPDSKYRFYATIGYAKDNVNDTIIKLNPTYFPANTNNLSYIFSNLSFEYYAVDYIPFPQKGFMYQLSLFNKGFLKNMHLLSAKAEVTKAIKFNPNSFLQLHSVGIAGITAQQPYINKGLFGYGDVYLRGMESFVIDGTSGLLSNNTLYQKLFSFKFKNPVKIKAHEIIPFSFYAKVFTDMGYVYNKQQLFGNNLTNSFLTSAGIGIDVVSIYDFVFRAEYSITSAGNRGFGFRVRGDF